MTAQELSSSAKAVMIQRYLASSVDTRPIAEQREGQEFFDQFPPLLINQVGMIANILGMAVDAQKVDLPTSVEIFERVERVFLDENVILNAADPAQNIRIMELVMAELALLSS